MPQFPYQIGGSALQAFHSELLEPLVTHVHGAGGGTQQVPRGGICRAQSPCSLPRAAGAGAAAQVGSATARLGAGGERWRAEPQPCFRGKEETSALPQWLGQLLHWQAGGRSGILVVQIYISLRDRVSTDKFSGWKKKGIKEIRKQSKLSELAFPELSAIFF